MNSLLLKCVVKLSSYCSSDFSRVAQFIFENVLRFQFELSSFPGLTEVKGHEGRAFTCSHFMSQYKPITIWEYRVAFTVNKIFCNFVLD